MRIRLVIAAAVLFALAAAPASAKIVVNRSIAGVRLDMSQQKVIDLIGLPDTTVTNAALDTNWTYKKRGLRITFAPHGATNNVTTIDVRRRGEHTASGVGVGSSYQAVRSHVARVHCGRAPSPRQKWCSVSSGRRITTFVISSTRHVHEIVFAHRGD